MEDATSFAPGESGGGKNEPVARLLLALNEAAGEDPGVFRDALLRRLAEHLNAKALVLYAPVMEGSTLWLDVQGTAGPEAGRVHSTRVTRGEELAGKAYALREGRVFSRVSLAPAEAQRAIRTYKPDAQSAMCVPVTHGKQAVAVFEVYDRVDGRYFSPDDFKAFTELARFLVPHLKYLETCGRADRERERLDRLTDIAREIGLQRSFEALAPLIESLGRELAGAEAAAVFLLDEETQSLAATSLPKHSVPAGEGIIGKAAWSGEPQFVPALQRNGDYLAQWDAPFGIHMRSMAALPLKSKEKVLGVLALANPRNIEDADLQRTLAAFASTTAVAVQNSQLFTEVTTLFLSSIEALAEAIDEKDPYTHGHSRRVRDFSMAVGRRAITDAQALRQLEISAILHDVGKIGTREGILNKPARLTSEEFDHIKQHVINGARILKNIPQMKDMIDGVLYHHERYDGSGYPEGRRGAEIPLFGRIIAIADTYDAMTSDRPYRNGLEDELALFEIRKGAGIHFDPRLVDAFFTAYEAGEIVRQSKRETG